MAKSMAMMKMLTLTTSLHLSWMVTRMMMVVFLLLSSPSSSSVLMFLLLSSSLLYIVVDECNCNFAVLRCNPAPCRER